MMIIEELEKELQHLFKEIDDLRKENTKKDEIIEELKKTLEDKNKLINLIILSKK